MIHFGYAANDIAFLRNVQDVGIKFKMLFCIYPGLETELLEKNVGAKGLEHVFTYVPPSELDYPVNFGMNMKKYKAAWDKKYPDGKIEFGFNAVAGYTTGLVIEKALSVATSLDQLELRQAIFSLSGKLKTLDGTFEIDDIGAQIGEFTPLGQLVLDEHEHIKFVSVYPHETATGKPVYPRPEPVADRKADAGRRRADADLCARRRRPLRALLQPGRARAQSRVRRHAHRQPRAWRFPDAGRVRRLRLRDARRHLSAGRGAAGVRGLPAGRPAALLRAGAAAAARG